MKTAIHAAAGVSAMFIIGVFLAATLWVEWLGQHEAITRVKSLIVMPGLPVLIPCLMVAGGTGFRLSKDRRGRLLSIKKQRMPVLALNGLLVLVPCALVLNIWAGQGRFDSVFYGVQSLEVVAGLVNLVLMGLNVRDGLRLSGRLRNPGPNPVS